MQGGESDILSLRTVYWICGLAFLLSVVTLRDRIDDLSSTALLGFSILFVLFSTMRYYYAGLIGLPLMWHAHHERPGGKLFMAAFFLFNVLGFWLHGQAGEAYLYNAYTSGFLTACLLASVVYLRFARRPPTA
jgi:hypothetical protein